MKFIVKIYLCCIVIFLFSACKDSDPIVSNENTYTSSGLSGIYSGTFSVTFKNYKNSSPYTQKGTIRISFNDSTYDYSAIVTSSSDTISVTLKDNGRYSQNQGKIKMNDTSWLKMGPGWYNSLYLEDTFDISISDNQVQISQENTFAKWNLDISLLITH